MSLSFLNEKDSGDTLGYGPLSYQVFNTAGNALMMTVVVGSNNVSGYLPRTFVSDNAHNWWILAGSAPVIVAGTNRRVDVWIAPNAARNDVAQGTYVSVGSSSIYANLTAQYYEISGFPTYAQVDFVAVNSATTGTSLTVSGTAATADYVVAALVLSATSVSTGFFPTETNPAGYTALVNVNNSPATQDMSNQVLFPSWNTVSAGAVSATWTWSGSLPNVGILVGFNQTPGVPVQPNANWPSVKVEAAFGFQPGNLTGVTPTWTDITAQAQDDAGNTLLTTKSGRDFELSQPAAGELDMTLANNTGNFNPANTSSPYYPNVLPEVPVRVSATWNGKTYGLFYSYANKWPQNFPNPQWGMSSFEGSDAIGIASQGGMPSALGGQVLADYPYAYYPFGEYYSAPHGQLFANQSRTNLKPMVGYTQSGNLATGQALNLAGDTSTGIGVTGLNAPIISDSGDGALIRDVNLPDIAANNSVSLECWIQVPPISGKNTVMQILALTSYPWNYLSSIANEIGSADVFTALYQSNGGGPTDDIILYLTADNVAITDVIYASVPAGGLCHFVFTVSYNSGGATYTLTIYLNGTQVATQTTASGGISSLPVTGMLAGSAEPLSGLAETTNYALGQVAVYPWLLPPARIAQHYHTGTTADSGDPVLQRVGKLGAWSGLGLPLCGSVSPISPLIGNADQIQGSPLADALYALTVDEGGMFFAQADSVGSLWYGTRNSLYNLTPKYVFGDNPTTPQNINPSFETVVGGALEGWGVQNHCTVVQSNAFFTSGANSGLLTVTGSPTTTSFARNVTAILPNTSYTVTGWAYAPSAVSNVSLAIDWWTAGGGSFISTTGGTAATIPAGSWQYFTVTGTSPGTAGQARYGPTIGGPPANGTIIYIDDVWINGTNSEVPYDPGSGFDYSDAYLFNIVSSQRTIATSQQLFLADAQAESAQFNAYGATAVVADLASEAEFMPRGPMSLPIETTSDEDAYDRANWSLAKYKQPHLRANQIELHPADDPSIWATALAVQQGDVVTVNRRPLGAATISLNCIVQQVEHKIAPGKWDVTITLAPYFPENAVIELDNTSFNELGDGVLGW